MKISHFDDNGITGPDWGHSKVVLGCFRIKHSQHSCFSLHLYHILLVLSSYYLHCIYNISFPLKCKDINYIFLSYIFAPISYYLCYNLFQLSTVIKTRIYLQHLKIRLERGNYEQYTRNFFRRS